ncbi:TPA: glycosyltransferase family 2 protein [Citrobacter freundii]
MTAKLSLSIIIATRNNAQFITEAIASVIDTMPEDCELIIVNDGSTDNSDQIIKEQIKHHPRVVYHAQQQRGVSVARNEGIKLSNGEYVAFIDGDDALHCDFYNILMPKIRSQIYDIIAFKSTRNYIEFSKVSSERMKIAEVVDYHTIMQETFQSSYWQVWSRIFRRALIANDRFPENLRYYEDVTFTPAQYLKCTKICRLDKVLYYYRINSSSITENHCKEDVEDMFHALNSFIDYANKHNDKVDYIIPAVINCYIELRKKSRKMHGYYKYTTDELNIIKRVSELCTYRKSGKSQLKSFIKIKLYKLDIFVSKLKYLILNAFYKEK